MKGISRRHDARGMSPRKDKEAAPVDERGWRDWWLLRGELGKRLGKRDVTGEMDPSLLKDERGESGRRPRKR